MAERVARHLSDRLGDEAVTAHHGSLSKEKRLDAETRLKSGTAEGARRHRLARARHRHRPRRSRLPDRIAASDRDAAAARRPLGPHDRAARRRAACSRCRATTWSNARRCCASVRRGELDRDRLARRAARRAGAADRRRVARAATTREDELFALVHARVAVSRARRATTSTPCCAMVADGFATRRGRRARARASRRGATRRVRGRRGARLLALTSGGAIPEVADYRVVLEPDDTFIGTLNEDFAIESNAGDVFQLGNASWRILQVAAGTVRVADAKGAPPTIPFWLGEAPARSDELSRAVSDLRGDVDRRLDELGRVRRERARSSWLVARDRRSTRGAAEQVGRLPRRRPPRARRHPDAGHARARAVLRRVRRHAARAARAVRQPHQQGVGARAAQALLPPVQLRAAGGGHRRRAAALARPAALVSARRTSSAICIPTTTRDVLVQALLDAPVFQTRWRWNTTISLAVPRSRGGRKVPPQLQRMLADDLMAAVFPDAAACLENIPGDRRDSRSSAGQPDGARLPRGGDGLRRPARACSSASTRRAAAASRATRRSRRRSRTRSSTRSRTRSSTTRRSRSGGRTPCRRGAATDPRRPATSARSTRTRSRGCATRRVPIRATPTSCTTRC